MADNYTFKDAGGNTLTHASKDVGSGVQVSRHIIADDTGAALVGQKTMAASLPVAIASDDDLHGKLGIVTETAPATDTASSGLNGRLQRLAQLLTGMTALLPAALGQTTKAASLSVALASDQSFDLASWSASETPLSHGLNLGVAASAVPVFPGLAGYTLDLMDIIFSTDTQLAATLYQSLLSEYVAQLVTDGAIHAWKMNEASGNITDSIGALTGTAVGTGHGYRAASLICADGAAIQLNGTSQAFNSASLPASSTTGALECWFWLNTDSLAGPGAAVILGASLSTGLTAQLLIGLTADLKPWLYQRTAGTTNFTVTGKVIAPYCWHHMIWQHDGTGAQLFLDGEEVTPTYTAGSSSTVAWFDDTLLAGADSLTIGAVKRNNATTLWFPGRIALCAWYNAHKAASVWADHYQRGMPLWGPNYFAAFAGVQSPLRVPIRALDGSTIYLNTSAVGNVTLQLTGVRRAG